MLPDTVLLSAISSLSAAPVTHARRGCGCPPCHNRREALEKFSARQLRLMFLLQPWDKSMMYGEQAQGEMKAKEALLKNFFGNVEVRERGATWRRRETS